MDGIKNRYLSIFLKIGTIFGFGPWESIERSFKPWNPSRYTNETYHIISSVFFGNRPIWPGFDPVLTLVFSRILVECPEFWLIHWNLLIISRKIYRTFSVWEPYLSLKVNKPRLPIQFEKFATQKVSNLEARDLLPVSDRCKIFNKVTFNLD